MKLDIIKERDTPLLSRKRVTISIEYEGATPSRLDLKKEVAKKVGSKEDLTIIKHVYTRFGRQKAKVIAHI
jgi:small subunit ribosomal protein S24e